MRTTIMQRNANDGIGGAPAAILRKRRHSCRLSHSTSHARAFASSQKIEAAAKPAEKSALLALLLVAAGTAFGATQSPAAAPAKSEPIPMDQIGAVAGKQYQGDGLSIAPTPEGARLQCVFQKLEGQATTEGLWLTSTSDGSRNERFRVMANAVERGGQQTTRVQLEAAGLVALEGQTVRFTRSGLIEEYSVSVDGVRQDFVVPARPGGVGPLRVELNVTGAKVEPLVNGARLVLNGSGRRIAYSRLRATDATGKELNARMEVPGGDEFHSGPGLECDTGEHAFAAASLAVVVDDGEAVYPVRIDPTFSDDNWVSIASLRGTDGTVYAIVVDGTGNLYIGGSFTGAGNVLANNIAKWDGNSWSALGSGLNNYVYALALSGSDLYVGGIFTTAGGSAANRVAKWDGSSWSALGSGLNNYVYALAVSGSVLYVGGTFTTAGGSAANCVAKWNGSSWSALGSGLNGQANVLAMLGSNLCVGGNFTTAGGNAANYVAKWDGTSWSALGSGLNNYVTALATSGSDLYAGGWFTAAGGNAANYVAKWDGSGWSALGSGLNNYVYALALSGGDLYAGGWFTTAGGNAANYVAKWNGGGWATLGSGLNYRVYVLAVSGSDLYVGGQFTTAGGSGANYVAKWNGSGWLALGTGLNNQVNAVTVSGGDLYVGGNFTTAGVEPANYVAKWNGSSWSALGSGLNNDVYALAVSGSDLYVGGWFTTAGGSAANYVAKWDGSGWSALGSGLNNYAYALAVSGSDLYLGGRFTTAGGSGANYVAKWNGSSWSALGSGLNNYAYALAVSGSDVHVGGQFTTAGGSAANRIAKWNGSSWSALGSGLNSYVYALAMSGTDLYVGGTFTTAGGKVSPYVAKALLGAPEITLLGNGTTIPDGDTTPSLADHTDFGSAEVGGGAVVRTFTIRNTGTAFLTLSGNPKVAVSGTHAADFTVTVQPNSPVALSGGTTTLQVTFAPRATGLRTAALTIPNNDDETPYDFSIQGTGTDTTPPSITCPANVTVNANLGQCYATGVALGTPSTSDNSGSASVSSNAPAQFPVGTNLVTWIAADSSGNSNNCLQLVVVRDTQPPSITCPAAVTVSVDVGQCYATGVTLGAPATGDNCSVASVSNNASAQFPAGTNTVTWTATDSSGNFNTCLQFVIVREAQPPTITCPADVTVIADGGQCYATGVALGTPITGDNCGVASVTSNAPAQFPVGTNTVMWTVNDLGGNTTSCAQLVIVQTTNPPAITIQPQDKSVVAGEAAIFTVVASCAPLSYQWKFNGQDIAGATDSAHTITGAQSADIGYYSVRVHNWVGEVESTQAALRVMGLRFSENFEVDSTANWTVNTLGTGPDAAFLFDYSSVGVPTAPSSGATTHGLRLRANQYGSTATYPGGVSVSPLDQSFSGDYMLRFDSWQNFNGPAPAGATGSTQITGAGLGTAGASAQIAGQSSVDSVFFGATGDGGSTADYRAYAPNAAGGYLDDSLVYAAGTSGSRNSAHSYYSGFGGVTAPAAQVSLFSQQTGTTAPGSLGWAWHAWEIARVGQVVTWKIDGLLIATVNLNTAGALGGDNVLLNHYDINSAVSPDTNSPALLFGLFDNVSVYAAEAEPTITTQPGHLLREVGSSALFSVAASSPSPIRYQWQFNGVNLAGATNSTLTLTNISTADAGNYRALLVNETAPATSATATLTVIAAEPPAITCPNDVVVNTDPGQCFASATSVALGTPLASDNSGSVSVSNNAPAQFPIGTNAVIWTATDPSGNTNTCPQLVVVRLTPSAMQISVMPDDSIVVSFNAISNLAVGIEASTNLLDWEILTNYADPGGTVEFLDTSATNFPQRFYRAVWAP